MADRLRRENSSSDMLSDLFKISLKGFMLICNLLRDVEAMLAALLSLVAFWRIGEIVALFQRDRTRCLGQCMKRAMLNAPGVSSSLWCPRYA